MNRCYVPSTILAPGEISQESDHERAKATLKCLKLILEEVNCFN